MFEAGLSSLAAFSSKRTRPVSRDATFIPTIADASSGFARISWIRVWSSGSVFGGVAGFGCCAIAAEKLKQRRR